MAQVLAPISDITALGGSGSGTFTAIDEATFSDADYISSNDNTNVTYECLLTTATDPASAIDHTINWRQAQADGNTAPSSGGSASSYSAYLYQGGTLIATLVSGETSNASSFLAKSYTLTAGEANSITNYADLRIRFDFVGGGGSPANRRGVAVSWVSMSVPDVVVTSVTVDLDVLNFSETLYDISAEAAANVDLDVLNFTETQYDPTVETVSNATVNLDTLNIALTQYTPTVETVANISVDLDLLNFSETLYDIDATTATNVTVNLDILNYTKQLNDMAVETGASVLLDALNLSETLHDVTPVTEQGVTVNLDVLNFSKTLYDITVDSGANVTVNLDVLSHDISLQDVDVSVVANTTVDLAKIAFNISLINVSTPQEVVRVVSSPRTGEKLGIRFEQRINQRRNPNKSRVKYLRNVPWYDQNE